MAGAAHAHNALSSSSVEVKATTGKMTIVVVNASTRWMKGSDAITERDVKVGDRVVIHAKPMDGKLLAAEVAIGADSHAR